MIMKDVLLGLEPWTLIKLLQSHDTQSGYKQTLCQV